MKSMVFLLFCVCFGSVVLNAETWTLTNKANQSIQVDYIFYDGKTLTFRKVGSMNKSKISPSELSPKAWQALQEDFGKRAVLDLEVGRRTKTSTDKERSAYSGYYSYEHEEKKIEKLNLFEIELTSSSHFTSKVTVEVFIFGEDEIEYKRIPAVVSMGEPYETVLQKMMKSTEYSSKSSYSGTYYKREDGDDKAYIGVLILNADGHEIAEYASSGKFKERMHAMKHEQREKYQAANPTKKKRKGK